MTRRREIFTGMGIEFKLNTEGGRDVQRRSAEEPTMRYSLASAPISRCAAGWK